MGLFLSHLSSWLTFALFTVLPVAFGEVLRWIYEWQVLETGILAIVAAWLFGRAVMRASQAGAARRPAASQRQVEVDAAERRFLRSLSGISPAGRNRPAIASGLPEQLHRLRGDIRTLLASLPYTDEPLTAARLAVCRRIATFSLDAVRPADTAARPQEEALRAALSAVGALGEGDKCRDAWQALVRANTAARALEGALEPSPQFQHAAE